MRFSPRLCKQHIGWHFQQIWATQSSRKIKNTGLEKVLTEKGIPVAQPVDFLQERPKEKLDLNIIGFKPKPVPLDETHPNWHQRPLLTYRDNNVLLKGLQQAKLLTNTIELREGLPESYSLKTLKGINKRVKEIILNSFVFDAEQVKLPKIKDPERPAFNFPRAYGISQTRRIKLLLTNFLQLIENISSLETVKQRFLFDDTHFSYHFEKLGDLVQFEITGDVLLTSTKSLNPITTQPTGALELPDIYPIKETITLNEENIYEIRGIYPVSLKFARSHPHTIFVPHLETEVRNLYEEPVTQSQIYGRSLLKTFTVAASYAREKYGGDIGILPKPVTVQCVQTNGQYFHFGVLQLNTLNLETNDVRNIWYQTPQISLFESCCYKVGKPVLEGYNKEVIQYLNTFYNN